MRLPTLTAAKRGLILPGLILPGLILPGLILGLTLAAATANAQTSDEASEQTEQAAEPAETAADYGVDTPLATVGDTTVTLGEMIALRRALPQQYQQLPDEILYEAVLEQLVNQLVLSEAAREAGVDEDPSVALAMKNQQRAYLANAYLMAEVEERATEERIQELYQERYVDAEPVQEVKAAHILVETEEEAREIKAKLDEGADFAEMAAEHGTDGTAQRGGDLGWFTKEEMVPDFAEAVFAMEPGTISEPVRTDFGWHLIKLEDKRARPAPPLEQVKAELRQEVVRLIQQDILEGLREKAEIEMAETPPPPGAVREDEILERAE